MSLIEVYPIAAISPELWRNGGGVTRTIAAKSAQWRVSLASIERNGPFSRFPGMSRVSLILSGEGVTLSSKDTVVELRPMVARDYDGDVDWDAVLVDGPAQALNVMSAKGRYRAAARLVVEPVTVRPGCMAIVIALDEGCNFSEGPSTRTPAIVPGNVLVSEDHAYPIQLAPPVGTGGRQPYAVLVTIEPDGVLTHI
ncbi:HutD family protein [Burkholderia pyrrocinia]|uniref:HutD/Ves family protein n=1 Tax=Burkholderia pyrrocinia TaxID=60550 RepID=UPI0030CFD5CA